LPGAVQNDDTDQEDEDRKNLLVRDDDDINYTGRFRDPNAMAYKPTTDLLWMFECCGKVKNFICFPCQVCTGSSTIVIEPGTCGVMTKKGIFEKLLTPGFYYYNDCLYEIQMISMKTQHLNINGTQQGLLTNDNLTLYLSAVLNYRIVDPFRAVYAVENLQGVMDDLSSTIIKRVVGRNRVDQIMSNPTEVAEQIRALLDKTLEPAGVKVIYFGIYQIGIPGNMVESMAQAAVSKREAEARKVIAQAEVESSKMLKKAAEIMNENKSSISLKYFDTLKTISEEWNTTVIIPDKMLFGESKN